MNRRHFPITKLDNFRFHVNKFQVYVFVYYLYAYIHLHRLHSDFVLYIKVVLITAKLQDKIVYYNNSVLIILAELI